MRPPGLVLPGESSSTTPTNKKSSASATLGDAEQLSDAHVHTLLGTRKPAYPSVLDLRYLFFLIFFDQFDSHKSKSGGKLVSIDGAAALPNVLKELDASGNRLERVESLTHLNKLKRLVLNANRLQSLSCSGLVSLELIAATHNRLTVLPSGLHDLKVLLHLDLSHNELGRAPVAAWAELALLKSLRVLTLSHNKIAMAINEFYAYILAHLKKLAKLEYLAFEGNPVESQIASFTFFCIGELPKLKSMDWKPVSKKDRDQARVIEAQGTFDDHVLPPVGVRKAPSESMRAALEFNDRADTGPAKLNPDLLGQDDEFLDDDDDADKRPAPKLERRDSLSSLIDAVVLHSSSSTSRSPPPLARHDAATDDGDINRLMADAELASNSSGSTRATALTAAKLDAAMSTEAQVDDYFALLDSVVVGGGAATAAASQQAPLGKSANHESIDSLLDELADLNSVPSGRPSADKPVAALPPPAPEAAPAEPPEEPLESNVDALDELLGSLESTGRQQQQLSSQIALYDSPPPSPPPAAEVASRPLQQPRTYSAPSPPPSPPPAAAVVEAPARPTNSKVPPPVSPTPRASQLAAADKPRPDNVHARVRDSAKATIAGLHGTNIIEETRRRELERAEIDARKSAIVSATVAAVARTAKPGMDMLDELLQEPDVVQVDAAPAADFRAAARDSVEFLSRLGLGTYGDAYQGLWRGDPVVLKKLRQQTFHDDFLREFARSVRALASVAHENLLRPIATLTELDVCAITPYIANGNLKTLLESPTVPLSGGARLQFARQIASALDYLHARDIIHRTLTPTNVLLDERNHVLVSDYGLCELKDSIRFKTQQLGRQVAYLAPELFPCERADMLAAHLYDRKVDVYAFGVLLWAMWSRVEPFADLMPRDVPSLTRQGKRPPLADAKAPPVCAKMIAACWHDEPAQRPEFTALVRVLQQPDEMLLGERRAEAPAESLGELRDGERKLAGVLERLCEMLASSDATARLKAAETVATLARNAQSDRVFAATPIGERLATLLATRGAGADVFNAVMRAVEAIASLPLATECVRRAGILPTLLAAARVAPLRDAALSALGALSRQSARVRDALRPIDGLVVFADVLRDGGASEATRALAAWCAASAMMDPNVREDALACQLPHALANDMASSNVVLSARCLEALTRLFEGPAPAAQCALHLGVVPVLIKPIAALRSGGGGGGQLSPLVALAVRGLLAAVRSGLGRELAAQGVTRALLGAIPRQSEALAAMVDEIGAAL